MTYSREEPSARYSELVGYYRDYHSERQDRYLGHSLQPHIEAIRDLVVQTGAKSILDYGSGKGMLYKQNVPGVGSIKSFWGVDEIACYDPGVPEFSTMPDRQFDGVISTDVLEHVPESDLPWIFGEMFSHARRFVYANVANYPAVKTLANGENAHCTQRPIDWWKATFDAAARPGIAYRIEVQTKHRIPLVGKTFFRTKVASSKGAGVVEGPKPH